MHQKDSPAEAGLETCGFDGRISCRPSGSSHMGRRLDAPLGHRMVLELQLPLRAQRRPGCPSSDRHTSHWHGIRRRVRDGSQRRIRQRLERPNCPEFDNSPTAWPVSRPLTIRQRRQLELKQKTYSFVLSLNYRAPPRPNTIDMAYWSQSVAGAFSIHWRCTASYRQRRIACLLWVKSRHVQCKRVCPLYLQERQHKRTSLPHQE